MTDPNAAEAADIAAAETASACRFVISQAVRNGTITPMVGDALPPGAPAPAATVTPEVLTDAAAALAQIEAIHTRAPHGNLPGDDDGSGWCIECETEWPCTTRQALQHAGTSAPTSTGNVMNGGDLREKLRDAIHETVQPKLVHGTTNWSLGIADAILTQFVVSEQGAPVAPTDQHAAEAYQQPTNVVERMQALASEWERAADRALNAGFYDQARAREAQVVSAQLRGHAERVRDLIGEGSHPERLVPATGALTSTITWHLWRADDTGLCACGWSPDNYFANYGGKRCVRDELVNAEEGDTPDPWAPTIAAYSAHLADAVLASLGLTDRDVALRAAIATEREHGAVATDARAKGEGRGEPNDPAGRAHHQQ